MEVLNVTLNPNDMGTGNVLSNGNLTVVNTAATGIRATIGKTVGKWYWEVKFNSGSLDLAVGVANKSQLVTAGISSTITWRGYRATNGNKFPENVAYGSASVLNDVIGVALDLDNGTLTFYKNGVSMGVSHSNIKDLGEVYPIFLSGVTNTKTVTFNFGSTPFAYTIPNGYFAYNLKFSNKFLISSGNETQSFSSDLNDLIPKMTSDILPSGIATCSSTFSTSGAYNAFNAFDKSIVQTGSFNSWVTASGQLTGWLAYEFPSDTVVNKYTLIHGYNNVNVAPKSWTFEGTNDDGLTWTVLDQRSNVTDWTLWTEKEFEFVNFKKFKKYRINISANNGSTSYVGIQEMKMYDTNRTLLICPSLSENIFIKYGISKNEIIDTHRDIFRKAYLVTSSTQLGSGKVFKQKIDTSKIPIKKASIT